MLPHAAPAQHRRPHWPERTLWRSSEELQGHQHGLFYEHAGPPPEMEMEYFARATALVPVRCGHIGQERVRTKMSSTIRLSIYTCRPRSPQSVQYLVVHPAKHHPTGRLVRHQPTKCGPPARLPSGSGPGSGSAQEAPPETGCGCGVDRERMLLARSPATLPQVLDLTDGSVLDCEQCCRTASFCVISLIEC